MFFAASPTAYRHEVLKAGLGGLTCLVEDSCGGIRQQSDVAGERCIKPSD
jgi:hypothetical protein